MAGQVRKKSFIRTGTGGGRPDFNRNPCEGKVRKRKQKQDEKRQEEIKKLDALMEMEKHGERREDGTTSV